MHHFECRPSRSSTWHALQSPATSLLVASVASPEHHIHFSAYAVCVVSVIGVFKEPMRNRWRERKKSDVEGNCLGIGQSKLNMGVSYLKESHLARKVRSYRCMLRRRQT
eukprot:scaffold162624_cov15-Tisochrysis_lutea.AAC.1